MGISRTIGLGYIALCLLVLGAKALLPLGPLGYAPFAAPIGPAGQPIELVIWYGSEKREWFEEAARRFEAGGASVNGRPVRVVLQAMGAREIADRVARQDWGDGPRPSAVSPASSLWLELLRSEWAARNGGAIVDDRPAPLVLTPLVAVAWGERARVLLPNGVSNFWQGLHDALVNPQGWVGVAQQNGFGPGTPEYESAQRWGPVKFGHTSPLTSNSGTQALILLAYGYHNKTAGLTPADAADEGFQRWLEGVETTVLDFGESTGSFMTNMVQFGPSKYDLVLVYENLAIGSIDAAESRWGQPLRVYYPPATIFSDHPYAILQDPLTSADERAAAAAFRDFLLSRPIQELALEYGFRPANPAVSVATGAASNPFSRYAAYGVQVDIAQQVETPAGDTIMALLEVWERRIGPYSLRFPGNASP